MKAKTKTEEWLYNNGYLDPHGTTRTYPSPEGEEGVIKETVELADILDSFTLKQTKDLEYATKKVTELSLYICKIQDDIASLVSTHRSDWNWNDIVEDVKKLVEKQTVNEITIGWLTKLNREQKDIIDLQTQTIEAIGKSLKQK